MSGEKKHPVLERLMIPPKPGIHGADTFFTLLPAAIAFKLLSSLLARLAWTSQYDLYSFMLDHVSVICSFLSSVSFILSLFAALRLLLDRAARLPGGHGESDMEPEQEVRRSAAAKTAALAIRLLNIAYAAILLVLSFDLARKTMFAYSPLIYNAYYKAENFPYPAGTLLLMAALFMASAILARLFHTQRRLKRISAAMALCSLFQALGAALFVAALTIAIKIFFNLDLTLAAEWVLAACCLYLTANLARGAIRDALKGDMTRDYDYRPLLLIPEYIALLDRNISFAERTGLSFKSLFYVRYTLRLIPPFFLCGLALLFLSTCLYTIEPHQEALLYRLGTLKEDSIKSPGLHFKLPSPIENVQIQDVARVRSLQIGYSPTQSRDNLWTSGHGGEEYDLLLGNGNELIAVNLRVAYHIDNLRDYVTRYSDPAGLLALKTYDLMMRKTAASDLNTMISVDRQDLSNELCRELNSYASLAHTGIAINEVIVESIHPPVSVVDVYQGVISAAIQKEAIIKRAQGDFEKAVNSAKEQGEAIALLSKANQISRVAQAKSDMAVYENAYLAYGASPGCYLLRKRLDTFEALIKSMRVYAFSPGAKGFMSRYMITNGLTASSPITADLGE